MDSERLYKIVDEVTEVYRKGPEIELRRGAGVDVVEVYGYEHTDRAPNSERFEKVDMVFVDVVVDKEAAERHREELIGILKQYPKPERLARGPSYIELAGECGIEQETAFRLMAVGKVLGFWAVITPDKLIPGLPQAERVEFAGRGFIMITGFDPETKRKKKSNA